MTTTHQDVPQSEALRLAPKFWERANVGKRDDCWPWKKSFDSNYGVFFFSERKIRAHRFAYIVRFGPIPKGLLVLHKCDNPKCVNPRHLYAGTPLDNCMDMRKRGRQNHNPRKSWPTVEITPYLVRIMRDVFSTGAYSVSALARLFGISPSNTNGIVTGEHWKDVTHSPVYRIPMRKVVTRQEIAHPQGSSWILTMECGHSVKRDGCVGGRTIQNVKCDECEQ